MSGARFKSVWDAIEDNPGNAEHMKLRSALMRVIEAQIRTREWTQDEAARRMGVTQPRVSDLMRGHIDRFASTPWSTWPARRACM